jgi:CheY-like chemotaxis protein
VVIDEDRDDFMLLKRALFKTGSSARVWWEMNWQDSLSLLHLLDGSTPCVCVVLEIRLNGTTGWHLLAHLRSEPHRCKVKFAVLTALADKKTRNRAAAESLDGFFVKTCDPAGLMEIARALHHIAAT